MPDEDEGPRPGHFLPGGAGDGAPEPERRKPQQPSLGQPRDIAPPYGRPSQQPGPLQSGWHPQQLPPQPPRRRLPLIAGLVAGSLVVAAGIVSASSKLISSFDGVAEQPLFGRNVDSSEPAPPWDRYAGEYKDAPTSTRVSLLADTAVLYGFHVMNMVGMADAESNLEDAAAGEAARNQLERRYHLQGDCLGASFVGAIRGSFPIQGRTLDRWKAYMTSLIVEEPKTTGSRRNLTLWMRHGFAGGLKVCNTWVAPAKEVS